LDANLPKIPKSLSAKGLRLVLILKKKYLSSKNFPLKVQFNLLFKQVGYVFKLCGCIVIYDVLSKRIISVELGLFFAVFKEIIEIDGDWIDKQY
jgi:hypothetical protein